MMAVNKVVYGGKILIDLTAVTVVEDTLLEGYTALNAKGELIVGKATAGPKYPKYTYTGQSRFTKDDTTGNWQIEFLTSGKLKFTDIGSNVDVFCVGGGGSGCGGNRYWGGGGGAGGKTATKKNVPVFLNTEYTITIGAGGPSMAGLTGTNTGNAIDGGTTTALDVSAAGGQGGQYRDGGDGGSGGGAGARYEAGCLGGTNGGNGTGAGSTSNYGAIGVGQGTTTTMFGESGGATFAAGGGGGGSHGKAGGSGGAGSTYQGVNMKGGNGGTSGGSGGNAAANSGSGGGGGGANNSGTGGNGGAGGSGFVAIRNARK